MTRVLVVDDHDFFRSVVVDMVNTSDDLETVGECTDGADVADAVASLKPHVVLMDVWMRRQSGLEAAAELQRLQLPSRIIMLTSDTTESSRAAARASGAVGYLIKGSDPELVLEAVRHVAHGGTAWPEDVAAGFSTAC